MNKEKLINKNEIFPIFIMGFLFVIIHSFALLITGTFMDAGMQAFENPDNPVNIIFIISIMLIFIHYSAL